MPEQPPVELSAPDISPYRDGNTGVDYVHTFDSGRPGPDVMINAVIHGNEICGAIASLRSISIAIVFAFGFKVPVVDGLLREERCKGCVVEAIPLRQTIGKLLNEGDVCVVSAPVRDEPD